MTVRPGPFLIAATFLAASPALVPAQWISFSDLTSTFLSFPGTRRTTAKRTSRSPI